VHRHHEVADRLRLDAVEQVSRREEIAEALAHLFFVDLDEAIVHPTSRKRFAGRGLTLGDLVFVVWEH
jgi:hypothetical protein